jgi:hypothetical protein
LPKSEDKAGSSDLRLQGGLVAANWMSAWLIKPGRVLLNESEVIQRLRTSSPPISR